MKASENFKNVISARLKKMGEEDSLFAESLKKEGKNIDDCITYILNTVQKSGCQGFSDEEIFGMAAHYYDEDKIEIGKPVNCKVVVNHSVDTSNVLSPEEIEYTKEEAKARILEEERQKMIKKSVSKTKETVVPGVQQGSLF